MSETKAIKALRPIDGNPAGSELTLATGVADFLVGQGAAEYLSSLDPNVASTAPKTPLEDERAGKTTQSTSERKQGALGAKKPQEKAEPLDSLV